MARLSKEEVEQIIERDLPDYQVVKESLEKEESGADVAGFRDSAKESSSDATSPDLDTLRENLRRRSADSTTSDASRRFLHSYHSFTFDAEDEATADDDTADDVIVAVRPKKSHGPFDAGYRTKAVIISGRSKRVIGRQG